MICSATDARSGPTMPGRRPSGLSTMPGRATKAAWHPALSAPATSPGVRGHQPDLADGDVVPLGHREVGLRGRLEVGHLVGGYDGLEVRVEAGAGQLGLGHGLDRVGQGDQPQAAEGQGGQRARYLGMRGQGAHQRHQAVDVVGAQRHPFALTQHDQRRLLRGGEVHVLPGEAADEGQLQHLREPLRPQRGVPQQRPERRVEGPEVQQCLIDVERDHAGHGQSSR